MTTFTAHNIDLGGGAQTLAGHALLADAPITKSVLRTLALLCPVGSGGKSIADLGALEGGYAVEFARAGYDTLGIEARAANFEKCKAVADALALPNLRFVCDDVRNLAAYGPFDAVFCSGLLYHLDEPTAFLQLLAESTRRVLVLQTHYAMRRRPPLWREYPPYRFSRLVEHEGNKGRWYREFLGPTTEEKMEHALWASYGNRRSFWIEKGHLIETLRRVGFPTVYEQLDFVPDAVADRYVRRHHRSLFVAVR